MKENQFIEGSALSSFGENFNHSGKRMNSKNQYKIYETTIDYLLKNKILHITHYLTPKQRIYYFHIVGILYYMSSY